ncbi:cytochrome c [Phenylobacterium sp. CCH12-B4]|jgi:cytochrome c553|uniref:c-type cytochrome n=1 Tax=unclassified Phenylobacterium TaxID=2640670 RepID=UPI00351061ED
MGGGGAGAAGACFTCHGLGGEGDGQTAPRLAGLPAGYLQKQLEDYAAGLRPDPAMRSIAGALDADDRARVAAYYANLTPVGARNGAAGSRPTTVARVLYHRGDVARGLPACAGCHGAIGEGLGAGVPPLADQPAPYLREQLSQWRRGQRRNDPRGVMAAISGRLTTLEAEALARYAAELGPGTVRDAAVPGASP